MDSDTVRSPLRAPHGARHRERECAQETVAMGILLIFSWFLTFVVLAFQFAVIATALLILILVVSRFLNPEARSVFQRKGITVVVCTVVSFFVLTFGSYVQYTTAALGGNTTDNSVHRYWKGNLGQDSVGTLSFMNPILRPLLYLLPRDSDRRKEIKKSLVPSSWVRTNSVYGLPPNAKAVSKKVGNEV